MNTVLIVGVPIVVAILLWMILSLPDEEVKEDNEPVAEKAKPAKTSTRKKKR